VQIGFAHFRRLIALALLAGGTGIGLPARADTPYTVSLQGLADDDLKALINSASQLVALKDRVPPSTGALRRRADTDIARLTDVLHSEGYYEPKLDASIDDRTQPAKVTVTIDPGPRTMLTEVHLVGPPGAAPPPPLSTTFGLTLNSPARSAPIVAAEPKIAEDYAAKGYPLAKVTGRRVIVDTEAHTMAVTFTVETGPPARFGPYQIIGLERLERDYVDRRIAWREGAPYDDTKLEATRQKLTASGLFSTVRIGHADSVGPDGRIGLTITLVERALRTVGAGVSYDTSQGIQATASWQHRDLFGGGEALTLKGVVGTEDNGFNAEYRQPDFGSVDRDLVVKGGFENQLVNAFRSIGETASVGVEQRFANAITAGAAIGAEHARINEITDSRTYTLVGLPLFVRKDGSDDLLNPTKGYRVGLVSTPYLQTLGSDLTFLSSKANGSVYRSITGDDEAILAFSGAVGSIFGTSLNSIPKDHRFFTGGGGSVRGFPYQKAGPRDSGNNPIGGRSSVESSLELRLKVTDTIGIVPFVDAGSTYASEFPDFSGKLRIGTGIGLRYYTGFGPVRLDLATPVNPQQGDSPIQIYVSLGQAF